MQTIQRRPSDLSDWSPFDQLFGLRDELNRLMELPANELINSNEFFHGWVPALDLWEDKDRLVVKAEIPGLKKDDIEVSLHDGTLSISGERKAEKPAADSEVYRSERFTGRFHRTIALPKPVQVEKVMASYQDGILTITLPKTEEAKPRQIAVNLE
ncbi:MAG: Hsp20/alpha crystallin family protein [Candidatus Omnitrophica bacterium]|nr:Hsp20/alpha crystallin family protein [Candidatus Omnitrophota bacterium]